MMSKNTVIVYTSNAKHGTVKSRSGKQTTNGVHSMHTCQIFASHTMTSEANNAECRTLVSFFFNVFSCRC